MSDLSSIERISLRMIPYFANSLEFYLLFLKSQMDFINPDNVKIPKKINITFEDLERVFEEASKIHDDNVDTNIIPENYLDFMKYIFSDISYDKLEKIAGNFLEVNFYSDEAIKDRSRGTHTLGVSILSGLTAKRIESSRITPRRLCIILSIFSGLVHDIRHLTNAHTGETSLEGFVSLISEKYSLEMDPSDYSHEKLGAAFVSERLEKVKSEIIKQEVEYINSKIEEINNDRSIDSKTKNERIKDLRKEKRAIVENYNDIRKNLVEAVEAHSTSRCPEIPDEEPAKIVRIYDKGEYFVGDLIKNLLDGKLSDEQVEDAFKVKLPNAILKKWLEKHDKMGIKKEQMEEDAIEFGKKMYDLFKGAPVKLMLECVRVITQTYSIENGEDIIGMPEKYWTMIKVMKKLVKDEVIESAEINKRRKLLEKAIILSEMMMYDEFKRIMPDISHEKIISLISDRLAMMSDLGSIKFLGKLLERATEIVDSKSGPYINEEEQKKAWNSSNTLKTLELSYLVEGLDLHPTKKHESIN